MICHCLDEGEIVALLFTILAVGGVLLAWVWR